MADKSHIEWTDATWNPITGCSVVSPGCIHCYAMDLAATRLKHHPSRVGLTQETKAGPVWTGEVRFNEKWLTQPLTWKHPRMIFVCAHGDLFHESVPDEWIDKVFAVMALAPQHTFQVLTKRAERMREFLSSERAPFDCGTAALKVGRHLPDGYPGWCRDNWKPSVIRGCTQPARWPLTNVWLGISAERQQEADARIPHLLATPAAVRFLSAEPLLGPLNVASWLHQWGCSCGWGGSHGADLCEACGCVFDGGPSNTDSVPCPQCGTETNTSACPKCSWGDFGPNNNRLDWVIVGGESGRNARPMHPDWARSLRDQCAVAGVPFFFKQWGAFVPIGVNDPGGPWHRFDDGAFLRNVGKAHAGRLLDGVEHNAMPETR